MAVFPAETASQEISRFLKEHTEAPFAPRGGQPLLPAIGAVIKTDVDGQDAYQICFRPHADPADLSAIRQGIEASPTVDRVLVGQEAERAVYGGGF